MALEAPPTWKEIEGDEAFQSLPDDQKRSTLEKWNDYSRSYAKDQGWDKDEEFTKTYDNWYSQESKKYQAPLFDRVNEGLQGAAEFLESSIANVGAGVTRGATSEGTMMAAEGLYRAAGDTVAPFDRAQYLNQEIQSAQKQLEDIQGNEMMIPDAREAGIAGQQDRINAAQQELRAIQTEGTPEFQEQREIQQSIPAAIGKTLQGVANEAGSLRETVREAIPIDPEFQTSIPGQVAQGLGQLINIPAYAVPGVGPAVSIGQLYQEGYDDALQNGATPEQATEAAQLYTASSAPFDILTDKLIVGRAIKGLIGKGTVGDAIKEISSIAAKEGGAEGIQQLALNAVAKEIVGYDPDRPLTEGVGMSLLVGAIVGGAGAGGAQLAGTLSRPQAEADIATKVIAENAGEQAEVLFNNNAPQTAQAVTENAEQAINTVDRNARTLEILEDLDQEQAGLQTESQGDERFAPPPPANAIRQAQIEADNLYSEDPDQAGQSSLRDWRLTLHPEVAGNIQAHGAPISELQGILEQGIDPERPFYTAPLNESGEASLGLRDMGTGGQVLVLGAPGQDIKQSGVQAVVVNDYLAPSVSRLQEAYPNVTWLTPQNATQWLNEQQPTRLDEPITIPQGQAQTSETGIAPEVQETPVTQTQGEINAPQTIQQQEGVQGERTQGNQIRNQPQKGGSNRVLSETQEQVSSGLGEFRGQERTTEAPRFPKERKVTPDDLPDAKGASDTVWYHGTGATNITPETASSSYSNIEGLLGSGIYLTDDPEIAESYSKNRRGRGTSTIYETRVNPRNVINFDKKLSPEVGQIISESVYPQFRGEISEEINKPNSTGMKVWKRLTEEVTQESQGEQVPVSEYVEMFQEIETRLREAGYDAYTHIGGQRAGKNQKLHRVLIVLDNLNDYGPANAYTPAITQISPLNESQLQEALNPSQNEPARNDSGAIPETLQPTVEEGTGEPSQVTPRATPRRVQIGSSPQTHEVIEELPQSQREQELGERYFRIRNERTGEEQTVESGDMRPVKGKVAEDAIKPEVDQAKERLNALTPAQKESVLSLNNNSGSVLIPDFQDLQQAVQNIASSLNQAYDNFTDWSGAMVRSFGKDIVRFLQRIYNILNTGGIDYLPGRENSGSILNPAGMFSKSTRQPFRKVQKDKKYKPEGIWSAAGKWNKQIFDFLGQKERNVSANLNATEFLAAKLQRERRKAEKEGIEISTETLNTALGNTDNRLTDEQYAEARQIPNEQERLSFEFTAKLENLQNARAEQAAALQSLPVEMQDTINEMRSRVDQLSSELRDSGAVSGDIQASIDDAMGLYLHRSYSIFDNAEGWKNFIYSEDPEAVAIRNRAEALFQDYARANAASQLIKDNREVGTPITRQEAIDQVKDLDVTEEAGLLLEDYLSVADKGEQSILGGRLPGQKNQSILKMRGQIPNEIRDLWGEQKDATANFAKTYAGMSSFLENHRFLQNVLQEGLITEQNPDGYIWKEGESPSNRPRAYTQLVGDGSKSMEPLNGAWMPPELAQAFTEYYGKRGDQNAVLRLLQAATGLSMKSKTAYSLASTIRNFVGNIAFMTANGNFNVSKLSDAQKSAWSNLTKGGDKAIRDRIENYIRLGVVGDNVGPSLIKEISEAANIEKTGDKLTQGNPILTKIWRGFKKADQKATDIYSSVDDFWKVFAFENELNKIKRAYPNETQAQQEQRAANVVRDTVPTYSLAPEIVRNLKSNFGVAVAPFITFTTEVVRTTYNTVRQGVTEIKEGNATNNQELRNIGIQRLTSFAATQALFPALGLIFKQLFDYDDEDEDAVRKFLPDWQKNAQLLLLPPDDRGNPRYIDVSFLDPYGYLKEPAIAALVQSRSGKSADQIALDASLASLRQIAEPFISEQILAGSIADIARNTTASGAEVYNPQDNTANIAGKAVLHVLSSFEPGTYTSLNRIYKGVTEQVSPTGRAYDTPSELSSLLLGQRVSSLDPQTSLDFSSRKFKSENQDSTSLFTRPFKSRGTIGENAIADGYQAANEAKQRNAQSLRDAYKAALTLGVPEKTARRILDDASIGQDAMREVISGVYRRYQPSTQSLNEVRKKNPERIQQLQQAISSTPATVPLR